MLRANLIADARFAAKAAKHNLRWIRKHPDRVLPGKEASMKTYLKNLIQFARYEIRHAKRELLEEMELIDG